MNDETDEGAYLSEDERHPEPRRKRTDEDEWNDDYNRDRG